MEVASVATPLMVPVACRVRAGNCSSFAPGASIVFDLSISLSNERLRLLVREVVCFRDGRGRSAMDKARELQAQLSSTVSLLPFDSGP